jgi:hypothetical protein
MPTQPAILNRARLNNFRLDYVPEPLRSIRETRVGIWIGGVDYRTRTRVGSLEIRDVMNDAPNTCTLTVDGTAPAVGQDLRITINANTPRLLFHGTLYSVELSYEGRARSSVWRCAANDDNARANQKRPFGTWAAVSASTIAAELISTFAPGLTANHVQQNLPAVSVTFDGADPLSNCLKRLATLVGGYFYIDDLDLHFYTTETTELPDPIDLAHPFAEDPRIALATDQSQLRNRVYGKGHGENVLADVLAGETIVPLADVAMFNPLGGQAMAGTARDAAQHQKLTYTGTRSGGAGSLVGPGALPSGAPLIALAAGSGIEAGPHSYAYTWATATGETPPSPVTTITTGSLAAPPTAPALAPQYLPGGPLKAAGFYVYAATFQAGSGETTPGPQAAVTLSPLPAPPAPTLGNFNGNFFDVPVGTLVDFAFSYTTTAGSLLETPLSPMATIATVALDAHYSQAVVVVWTNSLDARLPVLRIYARIRGRDVNLGLWVNVNVTVAGNVLLGGQPPPTFGQVPPAPPYIGDNQVALTAIPIGPAGTTGRRIYRTDANPAAGTVPKLAITLADNTTTAIVDTLGALGADQPSINTTVFGQATIAGIALGPAGTTARKVYRTTSGGSILKLQQTIANNTATTGATDASGDLTLGATAPAGDTSGLSTSAGQVNAGSPTLLTASGAPFAAAGGWVLLSGGQAVRYSGIAGNTLTGIPTAGPGSIRITVLYGSPITAAPVLIGVSGARLAMEGGSSIHVWIQADDLAAQQARKDLDAAQGRTSDGIIEYLIQDERRGETSLLELARADLALFARPLVTVRYATRDPKTRSGKPITVNLTAPPMSAALVIQDVTITDLDVAPTLAPLFTVSASSVRFSLEDLLRQLAAVAGGGPVT